MGTRGHNVPLVLDSHDIRKLTLEECLLFQGFNVNPNGHTHTFPEYTVGDKGKAKSYSNAHKYKQSSNCVTVTVIERITRNIIDELNSYINSDSTEDLVAVTEA